MANSHGNDLNRDYEHEHAVDHVARVRAAREAAEREMRKFGDVSEYEVRKVYGQRSDLNYDDEAVPGPQEHAAHAHDHARQENCIPPDHNNDLDENEDRKEQQTSLDFDEGEARQPSIGEGV